VTIKISIEALAQPSTLFCNMCARHFQAGSIAACLSAGTWWIHVCPDCLPTERDDTALREAALAYRETLLWLARVMERIAYGTQVESVTREQVEQANALDTITPKGDSEHDERPTIN
jgi:hypothetical protein